jgi:AcrR family transcriptional regulator
MPRRTKEEAAQTRQAILDAARHEFTTKGYANTSIASIADRTQVTHGALYHHFANKDALFRAVFDEVVDDLNRHVVLAAIEGTDALEQFTLGCRALFEQMSSPEYQQIAIADAPSVLGMEEWRGVDSAVGVRTTIAGLQALQDDGILPPGPVEPFGVLLYGALTEAGIHVARSEGLIDLDRAVEATLGLVAAVGKLDRLP